MAGSIPAAKDLAEIGEAENINLGPRLPVAITGTGKRLTNVVMVNDFPVVDGLIVCRVATPSGIKPACFRFVASIQCAVCQLLPQHQVG